ncbi:MAG: membrane-bound O-acyltransferase family protein, partial [Candidatus Magasanikbacteria bacterium CG11_big_fil_rev_8_21_14_0_20_39_34]
MLFNSFLYIFIFLPVVILVYFLLSHIVSRRYSQVWLVMCSLFYYAFWKSEYLGLLLLSIFVNFMLGYFIVQKKFAKKLLWFGITFNLFLLGFFKYSNFFIENLNFLFKRDWNFVHIVLPLAISFFTFQQIAYLVDCYKKKIKNISFYEYILFITFFPQLIAGPIVHHSEMMPQFSDKKNQKFNWDNFSKGIFLFFLGLMKKVVVADTFAKWATYGFDVSTTLSTLEAWMTSLSYTFQLYFDFSGYTDMALGAALMLNIVLPKNFNSPYKSLSIQDFWKRWHMTLSRFLRDYLYIPLGGNRRGEIKTYRNLLLVFFLGGLWHGAAWGFIIWGLLHGVASVIHRIWEKRTYHIPKFFAWFFTFIFVNVTWIFFRAENFADAKKILLAMFSLQTEAHHFLASQSYYWVFLFLFVVLFFKNSDEIMKKFKPNIFHFSFLLFSFIT